MVTIAFVTGDPKKVRSASLQRGRGAEALTEVTMIRQPQKQNDWGKQGKWSLLTLGLLGEYFFEEFQSTTVIRLAQPKHGFLADNGILVVSCDLNQ